MRRSRDGDPISPRETERLFKPEKTPPCPPQAASEHTTMNTSHDHLRPWGWSDWFAQRAADKPINTIARVAAVDRDQCLLVDQEGPFRAVIAGSYLHRHPFSHELPCVGDWAIVERQPGDDFAVIHALVERRTELRRKSAGNAIEYQMIAANVDAVIIVQSCHFDFNVRRLQRYLVMAQDGGAAPLILLTKTDLVEPGVPAAQMAEIRQAGINVPICTLSNLTQAGQDELRQFLQPQKTFCFVGSSGVGKSTLINALTGRGAQMTSTVSATGEGRHTTVRRELIRLDNGALVIDNPGMREFGILGAENGLGESFSAINALAARCRYRDCSHTGEPGCAVLEAVHSGAVSRKQLENFLKLNQESDYYQMSYVEKRKKDRDFGKHIKSVKKRMRG